MSTSLSKDVLSQRLSSEDALNEIQSRYPDKSHKANRAAALVKEIDVMNIIQRANPDKVSYTVGEIVEPLKNCDQIPDDLKESAICVLASQISYPEIQTAKDWADRCCVIL